jgi:predicted DCC family thiol-disulfide oxidoreductase YuxK
MTETAKYILFYDGGCRFCNRWVQWVVDKDQGKLFMFAALESAFYKDLHIYLNIERKVNSIAIIEIEDLLLNKKLAQLKFQSEAVKCLFANMQSNAFIYKLLKITPRFISDFVYCCVASVRKLLPVPNCRLYTNEDKKLFLNERDFIDFISLSL